MTYKYVELWGLSRTHDPISCGRIYLVGGELRAIPQTRDAADVLSHPVYLETDDGGHKVYLNEPLKFLTGLCQTYSGGHFHATKVMEDSREWSDIVKSAHPAAK